MGVYESIIEACLKSEQKDPLALAIEIMHSDFIRMHGPEHHVLDGACFLTAMHNCGVSFDLYEALLELVERGSQMPGATCGKWGVCGSASSLGAALAILHETGPLSDNDYYKDNLLFTSRALAAIAEVGGPRCCKRNDYISTETMIAFVKEKYGIELESHRVVCEFPSENKQCIGTRCPYCR